MTPLISQQASENRWFYLPNCHILDVFGQIRPLLWSLWSGHLLLMPRNLTWKILIKRKQLVTTNCDWIRDTRDIVADFKVITQIYRVIHSWFCVTEIASIQVAVNCLCCTSDTPRIFTNGEWAWLILLLRSLHANGTLDAHFGSRNVDFWFLSALYYFDVMFVYHFDG